jgi:hypothetical protein
MASCIAYPNFLIAGEVSRIAPAAIIMLINSGLELCSEIVGKWIQELVLCTSDLKNECMRASSSPVDGKHVTTLRRFDGLHPFRRIAKILSRVV